MTPIPADMSRRHPSNSSVASAQTLPEGKQKIKPAVYISALIASLGGLVFGYDIGGSGGTFTMPGFRNQLGWPPLPQDGEGEVKWVSDEQGWITSIFALGAVAGAMVSGYFTDNFGRRPTIMLYAFIFTVAAIMQGVAEEIGLLYAGRFIGGIGVGGLSMASTMYMSEIAPERIRGKLVSLQQLSITFGILLAAIVNVGLKHWKEGWRLSYCGNGFFSAPLLFMMFFCPESPRWLYKVGRTEDAKKTLGRVLNANEIEFEYELIAENERAAVKAAQTSWFDLFRPANNMNFRTMVGVAVLFLQQFSGINAIMYFAPIIFSDFLNADLALLANLLLQAVNFLSTFITIALVDKYGRRTLLIIGSFLMCIFTTCVCLLSSPISKYEDNAGLAAAIIVFCALYVISFAFSWGPVGWIVPSEIFPNDLRGKGMTLTTAANWIANFAIGRVTPEFLRPAVFDLWGTFLFFGVCCFLMGVFTLLYVPETRSVALEQMDTVVEDFRRWSYAKRLTSIHLPMATPVEMKIRELEMQAADGPKTANGAAVGDEAAIAA